MGGARYDGLADAYDAFVDVNSDYYKLSAEALGRLLGPGRGRCIDVGCGGGHFFPVALRAGWTLTGVDASQDQLRVAREGFRDVELVHADASSLPFGDATFDAGFSTFTHTDMEGFGDAMREALRVLTPGARFVYVGNHPCFVGAAQEHLATSLPVLHEGYRRGGRWNAADAPGAGADGWRLRLGSFVQVPLQDFVNAFAGFRIERFEELEDGWQYPKTVAFALRK